MEPKHKVLIVEDDVILLKLYTTKFMLEGFDVDTAEDGEEAIVKVDKFRPQIILLDYMLPKLNGLEILEILKSTEGIKNIPIIMLTNAMADDKAEKAMKLGASGYLLKAMMTPNQVVEKVKETLKLESSHSEESKTDEKSIP